jgi:hypothetical protein
VHRRRHPRSCRRPERLAALAQRPQSKPSASPEANSFGSNTQKPVVNAGACAQRATMRQTPGVVAAAHSMRACACRPARSVTSCSRLSSPRARQRQRDHDLATSGARGRCETHERRGARPRGSSRRRVDAQVAGRDRAQSSSSAARARSAASLGSQNVHASRPLVAEVVDRVGRGRAGEAPVLTGQADLR